MKPKIILMSHGKMAEETYHSAKMIVGDLLEAQVVSMLEVDGMSGTQEKLAGAIDKCGTNSILLLADLKGGTPANVALLQTQFSSNIRVVTGLNLAMVLEAAVSMLEDVDELADYLVSVGKSAIEKLELPAANDEDELEE